MNPTWRKPAGMILIIAIITLWCAVVVTVADAAALPTWAALLLYVGAGIAWLWLFPMRRILYWMEHGRWRP
ncbi:DUF2842 domain-containing protein [Sphingomonas naphthae]|uniref:DUF2842 domain-containing protein n=1 Tax=Sphingomonas naphthae TaxID=1813468 RepID=A0ABY7TGP1_9SPHN|nr:DUF2842 domain-containing protein [Sphingomonas naphthae]WCT71981.1 DUF2842 domain-containing protein [Sphingomonas naphthae]